MITPDQEIFYLSKRKKKVLNFLSKIKKLSLSHSDNIVYFPVELIPSRTAQGEKVMILNLEDDHILDILQKFNFFKIKDNFPDSENNQVYELEIEQRQFSSSEIFLLQELDLANSFQIYSGDYIARIVIKLDPDNRMNMKIFINNSDTFDFEVNRSNSNWKLLYEVAKNKLIHYNTLKHKNIIHYLNKGKDCIFYSKDKFKPTKILKTQNSKIVSCIPIELKK